MKRLLPICIVALFVVGVALFAYPGVSDWLARKNHSTAIQQYSQAVEELDRLELEAQREEAEEYNRLLQGSGIEDPFVPGSGMVLPEDYASILNMGGVMGYIDIPGIAVSLPIHHGTTEEVLKKGVGHLQPTALPVGGEGNHTVLTGHRGLPSAKLFTDLDQLEIGDRFVIRVLDENLVYQVDQIEVIQPEDTALLRPVPGEDYVTLITCTPYAINSHRLTVRGVRVAADVLPEESGESWSSPETREVSAIWLVRMVAVEALVLVLILALVVAKRWRRAGL